MILKAKEMSLTLFPNKKFVLYLQLNTTKKSKILRGSRIPHLGKTLDQDEERERGEGERPECERERDLYIPEEREWKK